jgi:hydrogenase nickel incorporation protein HypA/HybF
MHELALSRAVVDAVVRHSEGRKVTAVRLRVGTLRQVVPDSLAFNFEIVARGTVCEGARLEQERVPARLHCPRCDLEWDPAPPPASSAAELIAVPRFRCSSCGDGGGEVVGGDELLVESIDVEEAPCTAPG